MISIAIVLALAVVVTALFALSLYLAAKEQAKGRADGVMKTLNIMEADFEPATEPVTKPTGKFSIPYTGHVLLPTWSNYDASKMTIGGAKNVGSFTATFDRIYVSPGSERAIKRYAEQLRRVKRWRHYAVHAKKARTRKKYSKKLAKYDGWMP